MALHMLRSTPTFTKAMRGYDIEEVDEYVDALRDSEDRQTQVREEAEASARAMSAELARLRGRVAELEDCVRSETPRSISALAGRLTLVLEEAEAGASEAVRSAKEEADTLLFDARKSAEEERLMSLARTTEAEQRATSRLSAADEQATAVELSARRRAESILAEAEQRALARRSEIEAWVERVRTHVESEEARAASEFARVRAIQAADLADLRGRHDQMVAGLEEMGESLRRTVDSARASVPAAAVITGVTRPFDDEDDGGQPSGEGPAAHLVASEREDPDDAAGTAGEGRMEQLATSGEDTHAVTAGGAVDLPALDDPEARNGDEVLDSSDVLDGPGQQYRSADSR